MDEQDLWDMSDEDAEAAFKAAKAQLESPETEVEEAQASQEENFESEDDDDISEFSDEQESDENGVDQPENNEASDHDSSDDPEEDGDSEDNPSEDEEANPDGEVEASEEESTEEKPEKDGEKQPAQTYSFRANGQDYEFTSEEIVKQFPQVFGKAMDYTKKMQQIKPWRKTIDAIEGAKLSHEDVSLMIDVLKGDKTAINEVLKRTGTDTLDLDTEAESGYVAKDYGRNESALAIQEIVGEISGDAEFAKTKSVLSNEWDEKSWQFFQEKPEMIKLLHNDIRSGVFNTIQPLAAKLKVYDSGSKSDLEYYKQASQQHFSKLAEQKNAQQQAAKQEQEARAAEERVRAKAKADAEKRAKAKSDSQKRKAAALPKGGATDRGVTDYLDESDEAFDEWYKNLQNSM